MGAFVVSVGDAVGCVVGTSMVEGELVMGVAETGVLLVGGLVAGALVGALPDTGALVEGVEAGGAIGVK